MGTDVPTGNEIKRNLDDIEYAFSGGSAARKTLSSVFLAKNLVDTTDDVSCVSSVLAIRDVLPDNRDFRDEPCNKADGRRSCAGPWGTFQRAERDLFETSDEDPVGHGSIMHQARTLQGTWHHPMAFSRDAGQRCFLRVIPEALHWKGISAITKAGCRSILFTAIIICQRSAKKPSTRRLEVGMSPNFELVEGGAVESADSLGDFAREQRIHLPCTLPCLLAEAGYPEQLHLDNTFMHRREAGRHLGHGLPRRLRRSSSSSSRGPRCRLWRICSS
ncbi:hypothetical protein MTO96_031158 [Rhipicephalus appendiculatus]